MYISSEMILMLISFVPTLIMMVFSFVHVHEERKLFKYLVDNKNINTSPVVITDENCKNDIEKLIIALRKRNARHNIYQRHSFANELNGIRRIKEINKTRKLNRETRNENDVQ